MSNIRFVPTSDIDSATLTSSDFLSTLPVTNLQTEGRSRVARTSNATGAKSILGDFAGATSCAAMVLYGHNISNAGIWRLRLYSGAGQTSASNHTNLLLYSGDLRNTAEAGSTRPWTQSDDTGNAVLVAQVAGAAPDAVSAASKLQANTVGLLKRSALQTFAVADNADVTVSVYAKAAEVGFLNLAVGTKDNTPLFPSVLFDLAASSVAATYASGAAIPAGAIEAVGGGWYRCSVSVNIRSGSSTPMVAFLLKGNASNADFTSTATGQGLLLWGAQAEVGVMTGYVATTSATVTEPLPVYDSGFSSPVGIAGWGTFAWGVEPWGSFMAADWEQAFWTSFFGPVLALSFRLDLADPSNAAGYIQAKRLLIGSVFEPAANAAYGASLAWGTNSQQARTLGGSLRTDRRSRFRVLRLTLPGLSAADRTRWLNLTRVAGVHGELFVSVFPGVGSEQERDYALLAKFTTPPETVYPGPAYWSSPINLQEV
ncbi:MAG: hypothetical protein JNL87_12885 [Burkholderiaceae bacterium]|nr:hypothetical protein [Burkholderiaceae bacterium]